MSVTLEDFEIRYQNILKANPKIKKCSVYGCNNPRDTTPSLGEDTTCAYHRLLFDFWLYEVMDQDKSAYYFINQRARRSAFTRWRKKMGKEFCDNVVLEMAQVGINWEC